MNIYMRDPTETALACMIWMHGLGSDAQNMEALAAQLSVNAPMRHVFIDAPIRPITINNQMNMRAWYDITGATLTSREDRAGILQSEELILNVIEQQKRDGFMPAQIFLAGFSQGGAMALYTGLHVDSALAGVVSLSAYLPLANNIAPTLDKNTPIFIAAGRTDNIVYPEWTSYSVQWLQEQGFLNVSSYDYAMQHSVCALELRDLSTWLQRQIASMPQSLGVTK